VAKQKITSSSTAEYFSKNLQQVGFSSPTKAVLTTLKEAVDNSLDACEEEGILPEIRVEIEKIGAGTIKNTDLIRILVEDNGPGLEIDDVPKVFGEYLASSKFGRGRCSRGQQGIGISAATTWAQLTSARGAKVITKTKRMRQAVSAIVQVDIKNNKGLLQDKKAFDWKKPSGVSVEFTIDGRLQVQGEGGLLTYLNGTALVNPHLTLHFKVGEAEWEKVERVSDACPQVPPAVEPHPHTMKLGEFIAHSHLFGRVTLGNWLRKGFSRVTENTIAELIAGGIKRGMFEESVDKISEAQFKDIFAALQKVELMAPSTKSVMTIGEDSLSKSIRRLGEVDFFAVVTRRPTICDFKPVAVEVAVARLKGGPPRENGEEPPSQILRFANRVPLQFDKAACAMVRAIETVNWRSYGIAQPKDSVPMGPYVIAVSLVSPFIKFKNASKETVDASEELVEELRRALIQVGQRLSRHIRKENREADLEEKLRHIEQFCPILVDTLCRITKAPNERKQKATEGLVKLLGRDINAAKRDLKEAVEDVKKAQEQGKIQIVAKPEEESAKDKDSKAALPVKKGKAAVEEKGGAKKKNSPAQKSSRQSKSASESATKLKEKTA
jgi:DNA topoisomerase-6 subunit B